MLEKSNNPKTNPSKINPLVDSSDFEPTSGTKSCYFAVKKTPRTLGQINMPGLFDYVENFDKSCTMAVFLTEISALFFLARVISESSQDIPVLLLGLGAMAFLVLDFFFAIIHHFSVFPIRSKIDNELLCIFPTMRVNADKNLRFTDFCNQVRFKIPIWKKCLPYLSAGILGLLAIVKCFLYIANVDVYFANQQMPNELQYGINGLVFLAYFFCVYVHIFHTGYYLAGLKLDISENIDRSRYNSKTNPRDRAKYQKKLYDSGIFNLDEFVNTLKNGAFPAYSELVSMDEKELKNQIDSGIKTNFTRNIVSLGEHKIVKDGEDSNYRIQAKGILMDKQLGMMVENQDTALAKAAVALWGHYVQFKSITEIE